MNVSYTNFISLQDQLAKFRDVKSRLDANKPTSVQSQRHRFLAHAEIRRCQLAAPLCLVSYQTALIDPWDWFDSWDWFSTENGACAAALRLFPYLTCTGRRVPHTAGHATQAC